MLVIDTVSTSCGHSVMSPSLVCTRPVGRSVALASAARHQGVVLSLQDLGVTKVGHMKRILCGIKELGRSSPATEA